MSCIITIDLAKPIPNAAHDGPWLWSSSVTAIVRPDLAMVNSDGIVQTIQESGIADCIHVESNGHDGADVTCVYSIRSDSNGEPPYRRLRGVFDRAGYALRSLLPPPPQGFADATTVTFTVTITI